VAKAAVPCYGNDFRVPTVKTFGHDWQCKIMLEQDMIIYDRLKSWMRTISDLKYNGGG
jgi:hypothetical protein